MCIRDRQYLLPVKFVVPLFLFNQMLAAFLRNDGAPGLATAAVLALSLIHIWVGVRAVRHRAAGDGGQRGGFGQRELGGVFAEILLCAGLHAGERARERRDI